MKAAGYRNAFLRAVDGIYRNDAYHSLSIEGYRVTADLVERVRLGNWSPESHEADRQSRDALAAHEAVSGTFGREVRSLRLSDAWGWPLDTCLCPLGDGSALFLPDAFDPAVRKDLREHVPRLHPVDTDEARHLGCNALVAGRNVVLPEGCPGIAAHLEKTGFQVHHLPVGAYSRHGAGPKALVLKIAG